MDELPDNLKDEINEIKKKTNSRNTLHFLSWILIICGIISCIIKNDYNVFIGAILVICLNRHYFQNKIYYSKIMFQFASIFCIVDLFFMLILYPLWLKKGDKENEYWNNLENLHLFGIIMGILEFLLKVLIAFLLLGEYKNGKGNIEGLFNFTYKERDEFK